MSGRKLPEFIRTEDRPTRTSHHVCFNCRKQFHKPVDVLGQRNSAGKFISPYGVDMGIQTYPCPQCGQAMTHMGKNFRPPAKDDIKAWEVARRLAGAGFKHDYCDSTRYPAKLRDVAEFLEQRRPRSEGEKLLQKWLEKTQS